MSENKNKKELTDAEKAELRKKKKEEKKRQKELKKLKKEKHRQQLLASQKKPVASWKEYFDGTKSYGELPVFQSQNEKKVNFTEMKDLTKEMEEKEVIIRTRVHNKRSQNKDLLFIVLRSGLYSVQAVVATSKDKKTIPRAMVKFASQISIESVVDIYAVVKTVKEPTSATLSEIELHVNKIFVVCAAEFCPLIVEDAMKNDTNEEEEEEKEKTKKGELVRGVSQKVRLDNRYIDLRAPAHVAIFKIQSAVGMLFREYLMKQNFMEIHSPKICATASEGGSEVFKLDYFDRKAFLTQSPQLYKQMAIMCGWEKVFEVGPVFRAENSFTNRHLTEFTGLDMEMKIMNHYHEILETLDGLFIHIFEGLKKYSHELKIISQQYPFTPIAYDKKKNLILTYKEGVKLLREAGVEMGDYDDLGTPEEKKLGKIVKEKYGTDFYFLDKFPMACRPFYTMPCPKDPKYSNSYDLFIRGEEITSGAQRIHDPKMLLEKAKEKEVDLTPIMDYVNSFKYGAFPHGGAGIGLERVVMLYLGLPNIRKSSMFPRDPKRVTP